MVGIDEPHEMNHRIGRFTIGTRSQKRHKAHVTSHCGANSEPTGGAVPSETHNKACFAVG